eukprot:10277444-Alexandrium_andersonii.AAC.1
MGFNRVAHASVVLGGHPLYSDDCRLCALLECLYSFRALARAVFEKRVGSLPLKGARWRQAASGVLSKLTWPSSGHLHS